MNTDHDILPQTPALSALVRRIVMRLNMELAERRHSLITAREHVALFDLGEASKILDGVAILPGMAVAEQRARRDLLELYEIFAPIDPMDQTIIQPGTGVDVPLDTSLAVSS